MTREPEYSVLRFDHGWVLCAMNGRSGVPLEALAECRPLFGKADVLEISICHHLRQTCTPNAVACIVSARGAKKWRSEIEEWLKTRPRQLRWWEGLDVGLSSAAIFAVFCDADLKCKAQQTPKNGATPLDASDFGRCERLLKMFPEWQNRLPEVAEAYPKTAWPKIVENWTKLQLSTDQERNELLKRLNTEVLS